MKNKGSDQPSELITRRTGIDRRWIPSANHHPERRKGTDRRHVRKRSLADPLASDGATPRRTTFPNLEERRSLAEAVSPSIAQRSQAAWPSLHEPAPPFEKSGEEDPSK